MNDRLLESLHSVRAVLFDAVGTLIRPEPAVCDAYRLWGERFGSQLSREEIAQRFARAMTDEEDNDRRACGLQTSEERERQRWRRIVARVLDDATDVDGLFEALWRHFAQPESWQPYDDAAPAIARLADGGLVVGIASNFDQRLAAICRRLAPLEQIENLFVSSQIGYRKPSREFFRAVERLLGLEPHELLLVGDDVENDYHGARRSGWHAVLVDRCGDTAAPGVLNSLARLFA